jgi:HK97 family phage prohead protease
MSDNKHERRFVVAELRADGDKPKITGYAALFNAVTDLGMFREQIAPGAFSASLAKPDDVRALWNHDPNIVLGRNTAGTLTLSEDERGLRIEIDPPDTQWGRDAVTSIRRGDVSQMSFGFFTHRESWDYEQNMRTLEEVELFDVSPVTFPAYADTTVAVRSMEHGRKAAGMHPTVAAAIVRLAQL